jgi:hypothetical protein
MLNFLVISDVDCQNPPSIANGKVILSTNYTYYGAAALYECDDNYKLDGVSRRLCGEDGTWGHETPVCRQITCPDIEVKENLIVDLGDQKVGSMAKFKCAKGRYMEGNDTRMCRSNGVWAGRNPVCKPVDCGPPKEIEHGRIIIVNESTVFGGSAEYHCIPEYNRIGPYLRKCMENGKWSGEEPRCECELIFPHK